jgi:hypothetical protein
MHIPPYQGVSMGISCKLRVTFQDLPADRSEFDRWFRVYNYTFARLKKDPKDQFIAEGVKASVEDADSLEDTDGKKKRMTTKRQPNT